MLLNFYFLLKRKERNFRAKNWRDWTRTHIITVELCAGGGRGSTITIIAIVVPIVVVLVVFLIGFCVLRRNVKIKKYLSIRQDSGKMKIHIVN